VIQHQYDICSLSTGKRSQDDVLQRLHQLRVENLHADGIVAELLSIAAYLQRELSRDSMQLRASQRSLQEEQEVCT